jgi:hypothetical protein
MSQIFISHVEEDQALAVAVAEALEQNGYTTWYYERDSVPGPPYLEQASDAIERADAVALVISGASVGSNQVTAEVVHAFESRRPFLPLLHQLSHTEFRQRNRTWAMAVGAAVSIQIPSGGPEAVADRLVSGLAKLGITPRSPSNASGARPAPAAPGVTCTVMAPPFHGADGAALVQVWLHTEEQATDASTQAAHFDPAASRRASMVLAAVQSGTELTVGVTVGNLIVRALTTRATWRGEALPLVFRVEAPRGAQPAIQIARVDVAASGAPLATVNVRLQFDPGSIPSAAPVGPVVPPIRTAFLSYAASDRDEVARRAALLRTFGAETFFDPGSIRPGEHWEESIRRAIDRADAFMLFWSEAASRSAFVEREWRYALAAKGLSFIVPIALDTPMPPPPAELASLHFGRGIASIVPGAGSRDRGLDSDPQSTGS